MNKNNIIQLRLLKKDFVKMPPKEQYKIIFLDKTNFIDYNSDLNKIIFYIKKDIPNWKESPNYESIVKRFESDSNCFLFYYNNNCIGWNWSNKNVCFDWINIYQKLLFREIYAGGCFVTKSVNRPADAGYYDYNMFFDYLINVMNVEKVYGYVDFWNKAAMRVNLQNNWKFYNFLN